MDEHRTIDVTNVERIENESERSYTSKAIGEALGVSDATIRLNWSKWILKADFEANLRRQVGTAKGGNPKYEWSQRAFELFQDYRDRVSGGSLSSEEWLSLVAPNATPPGGALARPQPGDFSSAMAPFDSTASAYADQIQAIKARVMTARSQASQKSTARSQRRANISAQKMALILERAAMDAVEEHQLYQEAKDRMLQELELEDLEGNELGDQPPGS